MQKELGRYLFPVFLEKRKSKRHLKKIHLMSSLLSLLQTYLDPFLTGIAIIYGPYNMVRPYIIYKDYII